MQILSHEEAEERYGLTKEDLSEFQQESHVAIAKTLQMVEAAIAVSYTHLTLPTNC